MNTFEKGQIKILVYRDDAEAVWYATALELNLTIDGDDKNSVILELDRAITEYVDSARVIGSVSLLNQSPDPELLALWQAKISSVSEDADISSPYTIHLAATESLMYG